MATCHATLYLPGLLELVALFAELPERERPNTRLLQQLMARADHTLFSADTAECGVFELFDVTVKDETPPVAAVTYLIDAEDSDLTIERQTDFMRTDPVFVQPDRDELIMLPDTELDVSLAEAQTLADDINQHFIGEDWSLRALTPNRWYLHSSQLQGLQTTCLSRIKGRNILSFLPQAHHADYWRGVMNEIQMILHDHPINRQREFDNRLPINSLWFWGNGRLPRVETAKWQCVWGNDVLLHGLGRLSGSHVQALPQDAYTWMRSNPDASHLLVLDDVMPLARSKNVDKAVELWQEFLHLWLAPLISMIKQKRLASLTLLCGAQLGFVLTRRAWWRVWKRGHTDMLYQRQSGR